MNQDEHQRERMRAWIAAFTATIPTDCGAHVTADGMLASFDKRFPAPAAVGVATGTREDRSRSYDEAFNDGWRTAQRAAVPPADPEYESLRTKARYWDAVASRKFSLNAMCDESWTWDTNLGPCSRSRNFHTAEEAVQAAIDSGALAPGTRDAGATK